MAQSSMIRAAVLTAIPLVLAGAGATMLHRDGRLFNAVPSTVGGAAADEATGEVQPTVVGMNLGSPDYYSGEWSFNDLVQTAASIRIREGSWPEADSRFPFDATGHPTHVNKGTQLAVILPSGQQLPVGTYSCDLSDGWEVSGFGKFIVKGTSKHFTVIAEPRPPEGFSLLLTATRDDLALSSLSCKNKDVAPSAVFNPVFLSDIKPYRVLRFMDWMRTNNAPKRIWAERATPAFFTQGGPQGVALEHMVALANATGSDPWFNMPLDADPDYYANFATYVRDHLDPKLKAYVEYSNEVWNGSFTQGKLATQRGRELYPEVDEATANDFYYADRVRDVMGIWSKVFAGQNQRLVRVLAEQAVWAERADRALAHKDTWKSVDVLATAPYFSVDPFSLAGTGAARVDALFARKQEIVDQAIDYAVKAKKVAHKYKIPLVAYEAGQGFVGYQPDLAADLLAANRDPRIYDLYMAYLSRWKKDVGGLIVLFDAVSTPGPGGQYGHREYTGQPLSEAPKARAVSDFIAQNAGQAGLATVPSSSSASSRNAVGAGSAGNDGKPRRK